MGLIAATAVALILGVVAISTDFWSVKDALSLKFHMGLWKQCVGGNEADVCVDVPVDGEKKFPKNALMFVRIFAILGVVLMACALSCLMSQDGHHAKAANCLIAGGLSLELANIIWAAELMKLQPNLYADRLSIGWSMGLSIGSGIVAVGAGAYMKMKPMM